MATRRTMIAGGAGAAVLAALGYRAWDRGVFSSGEGPAYEAWQDWQGHAGEGSKRPLRAAILAASAHNSQPWLFEPQEDSITVYADLSRNLGAADPFRRELYVSLGCALYNLTLSAAHLGFAAATAPVSGKLEPNPEERVVKIADVALNPEESIRYGNPQSFFKAIGKRHTNRGTYLPDKTLPPWIPAGGFGDGVAIVTDAAARRDLGALIVQATERFIADPPMSRDSSRWFRTGRREIERHRDGISTDTAGLSPAMGAVAKLLPDQDAARADKYWLASTRDVQVATAPAYGIMFCDDRLQSAAALRAGERWQELHLMLTMVGLAAQPMNQPIEIMDRDLLLGRRNEYAKALRKIAGIPDAAGADIAFLFRLGYAEREAQPSPRRRLEDVIRKTGFA